MSSYDLEQHQEEQQPLPFEPSEEETAPLEEDTPAPAPPLSSSAPYYTATSESSAAPLPLPSSDDADHVADPCPDGQGGDDNDDVVDAERDEDGDLGALKIDPSESYFAIAEAPADGTQTHPDDGMREEELEDEQENGEVDEVVVDNETAGIQDTSSIHCDVEQGQHYFAPSSPLSPPLSELLPACEKAEDIVVCSEHAVDDADEDGAREDEGEDVVVERQDGECVDTIEDGSAAADIVLVMPQLDVQPAVPYYHTQELSCGTPTRSMGAISGISAAPTAVAAV
jgi:hypothetical protein